MRRLLIAALVAGCLHAATIRGVVVDNQTGRPLARATVIAQPIAGTSGTARSVHTDLNGAFGLPSLGPGAWLVVASRRGFAPTQYPKGPIRVEDLSEVEIAIRLRRFGAITGTVVDENEVGLQDHDVVAYRNARPLAVAARAKTDDRGVYRIEGLQPGSYLVRTGSRQSDEGSYLPTFSREVARLEEARPVEVQYDREIAGVDLRPFPGVLVTLAGRVYSQVPVTLTLISDVGAQSVSTVANGDFRFPPVAPGMYELYAQGKGVAAWETLNLYRDVGDHRVRLAPLPELLVTIEDTAGRSLDPAAVPILIRRRDLSGEGKIEPFRGYAGALSPGRWEIALAPTPAYYTVGAPPWTEVIVTAPGPVTAKLVLSNRPAILRGAVRNAAGNAVAGVPVHLGSLRTVRTDVDGRFEFYGLAPGAYRVLATFDAESPTEANSVPVELAEGQERSLDLEVYVNR